VNVVTLFKAVDALMAFREAAKRFKGSSTPSSDPARVPEPASPPTAMQGLAGQIETRMTNVVVAALKEAFDRDHARLELERSQIDEQRRRAEAAMRLEIRRQAADRELARLRLVAGAAMVGWISSVVMLGAGFVGESTIARACIAGGWVLLLGALGAAFSGQRGIGASLPDDAHAADGGTAGAASLWLLLAGLAATAVSLLL
jgi:hypothetical protein